MHLVSMDGLALAMMGDTVLTLWQGPSRAARVRFLFEKTQELLINQPGGVLVCQEVLPTATPPDGPARAENAAQLAAAHGQIRRIVTVPVGDAFSTSVVRTAMRGIFLLSGHSKLHLVASTMDEGMSLILEKAGPRTPSREALWEALEALHARLGEPPPVRPVPVVRPTAR